jgi:hypothetical protein
MVLLTALAVGHLVHLHHIVKDMGVQVDLVLMLVIGSLTLSTVPAELDIITTMEGLQAVVRSLAVTNQHQVITVDFGVLQEAAEAALVAMLFHLPKPIH